MGRCISYLWTSRKPMIYLEGIFCTILYNYCISIEFGISLKLVRLIKIYLNKTYSRVRVGKYFSDRFPFKSGLKQGDALQQLLFKFALEYALRRKRKTYSITGQDGPSGLQEVEAPRIFRQSAHEVFQPCAPCFEEGSGKSGGV